MQTSAVAFLALLWTATAYAAPPTPVKKPSEVQIPPLVGHPDRGGVDPHRSKADQAEIEANRTDAELDRLRREDREGAIQRWEAWQADRQRLLDGELRKKQARERPEQGRESDRIDDKVEDRRRQAAEQERRRAREDFPRGIARRLKPWFQEEAPPEGRFGKVTLPSGAVLTDSRVLVTQEQFRNLFQNAQRQPGAQHNKAPVYVEFYPDQSPPVGKQQQTLPGSHRNGRIIATAVSLSAKKIELEGPALAFYEDGTPKIIANYKQNEIDGALHVYDAEGLTKLYVEFKSGRRDGFSVAFVNGWPVVVQKWSGGILVECALVVDGQAIVDMPGSAIGLAVTLGHAKLEDMLDQVLKSENEMRAVVLKWYRDMKAKHGKELARANGVFKRASSIRDAELQSSAANSSFQQAWQGMVYRSTNAHW